jgi:hypothetical protein
MEDAARGAPVATRWGIFHAGIGLREGPEIHGDPQRERVSRRATVTSEPAQFTQAGRAHRLRGDGRMAQDRRPGGRRHGPAPRRGHGPGRIADHARGARPLPTGPCTGEESTGNVRMPRRRQSARSSAWPNQRPLDRRCALEDREDPGDEVYGAVSMDCGSPAACACPVTSARDRPGSATTTSTKPTAATPPATTQP